MEHSNRGLFSLALFSDSIHELLHPPPGQISYLDGLRSIAVLLVINCHLSAQFVLANGPNLYSRLPFVMNGGWVGVDLFFVLSGFFIGGQLWREFRNRGSINVSRFVVRRGFRIWPLYFFTFLSVLTCLVIIGSSHVSDKEYGWSDIIFITNFHNRGLVMGSWSLCTEEQFYIVAPLGLFLLARYVKSIQALRPWLWGALFVAPIIRTAVWVHASGRFFMHSPALFAPIYYSSITHYDGLVMGLTISNFWVAREKPSSKFASPGILIVAAVALGIGLHQLQKEIFDFTILALGCGSFVWFGLQKRPAFFNSRLFYWISRLSFGMYLNHEYMCPWIVRALLSRLSFAARLPVLTEIVGVALVTLLSIGIALITYCCVEYPFLQIRKMILERESEPRSIGCLTESAAMD